MNFFELISKRESCRDYASRKVEREKLVRCIQAARIAPSACNAQPWHFTIVDDPALQPAMAHACQGMGMNRFANQVPAFIVVEEDRESLLPRIGGKWKDQDYVSVDLGIAATHICLAATEQGLSTCMLGWFREKELKQLLHLPKHRRVRLVICVGYSNGAPLRKKMRRDLRDIADWKGHKTRKMKK